MSQDRRRTLVLAAVAAGAVAVVALVSGLMLASDAYRRLVLANESSDLDCEDLPAVEEVRTAVDEAEPVIDEIHRQLGGAIEITVDEERCPGRAELVIHHNAQGDKDRARELLADSNLGELPISWVNV